MNPLSMNTISSNARAASTAQTSAPAAAAQKPRMSPKPRLNQNRPMTQKPTSAQARARQVTPVVLRQEFRRLQQKLTAKVLQETQNVVEKQNHDFTEANCDQLKPTPARIARIRQTCAKAVSRSDLSEIGKTLTPANQQCLAAISKAFIDINTHLWKANTQDNINLFFRCNELESFLMGLRGESKRHSLEASAGAYNFFKLAQASPLGLFSFTSTINGLPCGFSGKPHPPFWHAAHQVRARCREILAQAGEHTLLNADTPLDADPIQSTQLLAARLFLDAVSGSEDPDHFIRFREQPMQISIGRHHGKAIQRIPQLVLEHPALVALTHKLARNDTISAQECNGVINQLQGFAKAHLDKVQLQFNLLTAHTPALKSAIDQTIQESIDLRYKDAIDEIKSIDRHLNHHADKDDPQWRQARFRRRSQMLEIAELYDSGSYTAHKYALSGLNYTQTARDLINDYAPLPEFLPEFINYGLAPMDENAPFFSSIKPHLLPAAVQSLGLDPDLPHLLENDIRRTQGLVAKPKAPVGLQELVNTEKDAPTPEVSGEINEDRPLLPQQAYAPTAGAQNGSTEQLQPTYTQTSRLNRLSTVQRFKTALHNITTPLVQMSQRIRARIKEMRTQNHSGGFEFQQRQKQPNKLKALVDLRETPAARVSGSLAKKTNKSKVIIGPFQEVHFSMKDQHQNLERVIHNQTPKPLIVRHYWNPQSATFQSKAKGDSSLRDLSNITVVTLDNIESLQSQGIAQA